MSFYFAYFYSELSTQFNSTQFMDLEKYFQFNSIQFMNCVNSIQFNSCSSENPLNSIQFNSELNWIELNWSFFELNCPALFHGKPISELLNVKSPILNNTAEFSLNTMLGRTRHLLQLWIISLKSIMRTLETRQQQRCRSESNYVRKL